MFAIINFKGGGEKQMGDTSLYWIKLREHIEKHQGRVLDKYFQDKDPYQAISGQDP